MVTYAGRASWGGFNLISHLFKLEDAKSDSKRSVLCCIFSSMETDWNHLLTMRFKVQDDRRLHHEEHACRRTQIHPAISKGPLKISQLWRCSRMGWIRVIQPNIEPCSPKDLWKPIECLEQMNVNECWWIQPSLGDICQDFLRNEIVSLKREQITSLRNTQTVILFFFFTCRKDSKGSLITILMCLINW